MSENELVPHAGNGRAGKGPAPQRSDVPPGALAQAAELALDGDYDQALHVLRALAPAIAQDPRACDLVARIHAQRGDRLEAERHWRRAARLDPSTAAYEEGIASLRQAPPSRGAFLLSAAGALLALLTWHLLISGPRDEEVRAGFEDLTRQLEETRALQNEERRGLEASLAETVRSLQARNDDAWLAARARLEDGFRSAAEGQASQLVEIRALRAAEGRPCPGCIPSAPLPRRPASQVGSTWSPERRGPGPFVDD